MTVEEKWRVYGDIREIAPYLTDIPDHPFQKHQWRFWETKPEDDLFHTKTVMIPGLEEEFEFEEDSSEFEVDDEEIVEDGDSGVEEGASETEEDSDADSDDCEGEAENDDEEDDEDCEIINENLQPLRCIFQMSDGRCGIHAYCLDNNIDWYAYKFNICVTFPLDIIFEDVTYVDFLQDHELFLEKVDCVTKERSTDPSDLKKPVVIACKDVLIQRLGEDRYKKILEIYEDFKASNPDL